MTGQQLCAMASGLYSEEMQVTAVREALVQFGLSDQTAKRLCTKFRLYRGSCWIGAAFRMYDDQTLLSVLKNCSNLPPSQWPSQRQLDGLPG